jgi:putative nucleotide binding protein
MDLLDARRKAPFASFKDLNEKVKFFPDPVKAIVRRIFEELEGKEKYYLFVRPPHSASDERERRF